MLGVPLFLRWFDVCSERFMAVRQFRQQKALADLPRGGDVPQKYFVSTVPVL